MATPGATYDAQQLPVDPFKLLFCFAQCAWSDTSYHWVPRKCYVSAVLTDRAKSRAHVRM